MALVLTGLHWLATVLIVMVTAPQMVAAGYHARRQFAMYHEMAEDTRLRHYVAELSDRISVVISHRFSNVRLAEHIIVLDEGSVAGEGNHKELMAEGGL